MPLRVGKEAIPLKTAKPVRPEKIGLLFATNEPAVASPFWSSNFYFYDLASPARSHCFRLLLHNFYFIISAVFAVRCPRFRRFTSRSTFSRLQSPNSSYPTADRCPLTSEKRGRFRGFTLLELLVVIAIISILFVLLVPAFTTRKSADDMTNAAYTITGVLEQARAYAMGNNTY